MNNDAIRSAIKLILVFLTLTVFLFTWLTNQLGDVQNLLLIAGLATLTFLTFFVLNLLQNRAQRKKRKARESIPRSKSPQGSQAQKRSHTSFALREKKSGLSWGGGNVKASEATRGTKRRFLGK